MILLRTSISYAPLNIAFTKTKTSIIYNKMHTGKKFEDTIIALNSLQTNAEYLKKARNKIPDRAQTLGQDEKYLKRCGIPLETLDRLSVIHITGTKGKGTTSAFCESILRHHGFSTGFFSSPHLIDVKERIRLNGKPISEDKFVQYFWDVYENLDNNKEHDYDMPLYFRFLTVLAFKTFLAEKVDVAIVEVGIGGEYDCTNILRKVPVVGITTLGFDHMSLLGSSIEEIAWNKGGIMKKYCKAFTVPQSEKAIKILKERSVEKKCSLKQITIKDVAEIRKQMYFPNDAVALNAALALNLSESWCKNCGKLDTSNFKTNEKTLLGLKNCFWPGRYQVIYLNTQTYYIDGAHTVESIDLCLKWFLECTSKCNNPKVLIFNATGDRNSIDLLKILHKGNFDKVIFVPNIAKPKTNGITLFSTPQSEQMSRCKRHHDIWLEFESQKENRKNEEVFVCQTVQDTLKILLEGSKYDVLVTGSLHLVGAFLSIIDPQLSGQRHIQPLQKEAVNLKG